MIITVSGAEQTLDQICKQLQKLVDVIAVLDHTEDATVERELCLCKVKVDRESRSEIMQIVDIFRANIVDVAPESIIVEVTGDEDKVDSLHNLLRPFGIVEVMRTGMIAMNRGMSGHTVSEPQAGRSRPRADGSS